MRGNPFPKGHGDDRETYLDWLRYLCGSVLRKMPGLSEEEDAVEAG